MRGICSVAIPPQRVVFDSAAWHAKEAVKEMACDDHHRFPWDAENTAAVEWLWKRWEGASSRKCKPCTLKETRMVRWNEWWRCVDGMCFSL